MQAEKGEPLTDQSERVAAVTREVEEGPPPSDRSIKEIIEALRPQLQELVSKQMELTKAELAPSGRRAGLSIGLLLTGAAFMLLFTIFICFTVVYAISLALPLWLSFLIVSVILLVLGAILAGAGAASLRKVDPVPRRSIRALRQNIDWVKGQLKR